MTLRLAACAAALFLFAAAPALAQEADGQADGTAAADTTTGTKAKAKTAQPATPVDIVANEMEILDKEKKAIFRGAVDATKGTTKLRSDELVVTYADVKQPDGTTKTDATDLDAKGNVLIVTPKEKITGDWAKYDPQTEKLTVGGTNVRLVQGTTVLVGQELHADLKTGRTQMTGGRVKGSFLPK
ncbi:LptA/OstA family protein [Aestuariivirga litoralis]|uniref:LptA/OstA family protein n=1 Tax=Aestuariivirga litoralis TaxID=2650924 RepID=UPI0011B38963|nr:LptA/OstA family protein [Aestuariivirga litoralis]